MDDYTSFFDMKFTEGDISLNKVSASDIGEIVIAFETLLLSKIQEDYPELKRDEFKVSLIGLKNGSICTNFELSNYPKFADSCLSVFNAIRVSKYSNLNQKGFESLKKILNFAQSYNCRTVFYHINGNSEIVAEIPQNFQLPTLSYELRTKTMVYGYLTTIGGKVPNVHIELINGKKLICSVTEDQAKTLGNRLYNWIGLIGDAKWDYRLREYVEFKVNEIIDYQPGKEYSGLEEISKEYGKYFSEIKDVIGHIDDLRNSHGED